MSEKFQQSVKDTLSQVINKMLNSEIAPDTGKVIIDALKLLIQIESPLTPIK